MSRKGSGKLDTASSAQLSTAMSPNVMQPTPYSHGRPAGPPERVPTGTFTTGGYVPPHIRAMNREAPGMLRLQSRVENLIDVDTKTESSVSNPYEDTWSSNGTVGPWSAVDTRRRNALYEPQRSVEERVLPARAHAPAPAGPAPRAGGWAKAVSTPPEVATITNMFGN